MITKNSAKINDTPEIYPYDLQYAYDNDELGKFKKNDKLNIACADAIAKALKSAEKDTGDYKNVDVKQILSDILEQGFTLERIAFVTACSIYNLNLHANYSDVKRWAFDELLDLVSKEMRDASGRYSIRSPEVFDFTFPFMVCKFAGEVIKEDLNQYKLCSMSILDSIKTNFHNDSSGRVVDYVKALADVLEQGYTMKRIVRATAVTVVHNIDKFRRRDPTVLEWAECNLFVLPSGLQEDIRRFAANLSVLNNSNKVTVYDYSNFARKIIEMTEGKRHLNDRDKFWDVKQYKKVDKQDFER